MPPAPTTQGQIPLNQAAVNLQRELGESQDETTGGAGVGGTGSVAAAAAPEKAGEVHGTGTHAGQGAMQKEIEAMNKAQEAKGQKATQPPRFSKCGYRAGRGRQTSPLTQHDAVGRSILHYAWESGWSPMSIARSPWGPQLIGRYSSRRFASLPEEDIRDMHSYIYRWVGVALSGTRARADLTRGGAASRAPRAAASTRSPISLRPAHMRACPWSTASTSSRYPSPFSVGTLSLANVLHTR